eukprot:Clim_evm19s153 gene=Clim_evmTU19s153
MSNKADTPGPGSPGRGESGFYDTPEADEELVMIGRANSMVAMRDEQAESDSFGRRTPSIVVSQEGPETSSKASSGGPADTQRESVDIEDHTLQQRYRKVKQALRKAVEQNQQLVERLNETESRIQMQSERLARERATTAADRDKLIFDLEIKNQELEDKLSKLQNDLDSKKVESSNMESIHVGTDKDMHSLVAEIGALKSQLEDALREVDEFNEERKQWTKDREQLKKEGDLLEEERDVLVRELQELKEKLANAQQREKSEPEELEQVQALNDMLRDELHALQKAHEQLNKKFNAAKVALEQQIDYALRAQEIKTGPEQAKIGLENLQIANQEALLEDEAFPGEPDLDLGKSLATAAPDTDAALGQPNHAGEEMRRRKKRTLAETNYRRSASISPRRSGMVARADSLPFSSRYMVPPRVDDYMVIEELEGEDAVVPERESQPSPDPDHRRPRYYGALMDSPARKRPSSALAAVSQNPPGGRNRSSSGDDPNDSPVKMRRASTAPNTPQRHTGSSQLSMRSAVRRLDFIPESKSPTLSPVKQDMSNILPLDVENLPEEPAKATLKLRRDYVLLRASYMALVRERNELQSKAEDLTKTLDRQQRRTVSESYIIRTITNMEEQNRQQTRDLKAHANRLEVLRHQLEENFRQITSAEETRHVQYARLRAETERVTLDLGLARAKFEKNPSFAARALGTQPPPSSDRTPAGALVTMLGDPVIEAALQALQLQSGTSQRLKAVDALVKRLESKAGDPVDPYLRQLILALGRQALEFAKQPRAITVTSTKEIQRLRSELQTMNAQQQAVFRRAEEIMSSKMRTVIKHKVDLLNALFYEAVADTTAPAGLKKEVVLPAAYEFDGTVQSAMYATGSAEILAAVNAFLSRVRQMAAESNTVDGNQSPNTIEAENARLKTVLQHVNGRINELCQRMREQVDQWEAERGEYLELIAVKDRELHSLRQTVTKLAQIPGSGYVVSGDGEQTITDSGFDQDSGSRFSKVLREFEGLKADSMLALNSVGISSTVEDTAARGISGPAVDETLEEALLGGKE